MSCYSCIVLGFILKLIKKKKKIPHRHRQQYGDCRRERGLEGGRRGLRRLVMMEGYVTWGGEHTIRYADDGL